MIEINFLSSPDPEVIGTYKLLYDSISLGTSTKNDLIIEDPKLSPHHILLTASKDGLICEGIDESMEYQANEKYFKGKKKLVKKDKVKIGNTIFEIMDFSLEPEPEKATSLKDAYENLLKVYPEQEKIIDEMENEISRLEDLIVNQPSNA
jgi:hypothetical protein